MITSTPTSRIRQPKSYLFIGPPGTGKTVTAMQFPRPYFLDCDCNLQGPERYNRDVVKFTTPIHYDQIALDDAGLPVPPEQRWLRLRAKALEAVKLPDIDTIILDSLSHLSVYLADRLMSLQKRSTMEIQDWIPFVSAMIGIFTQLRYSGKTFILICHEITERNSKGDVDEYTPNVSSAKIRDALPGFFTDAYRFYSKAGPNGPTYYIAPERTQTSVGLKNSYGMPVELEIPRGKSAFDILNKYLKLV